MVLRGAAVLAAVSFCVFAGCGGDDEPAASGDAAAAAKPKVVTREVPAKKKDRADDVSMDAPKSIGSGLVSIDLSNEGKAPHDAQLIRIEGKRTRKAVINAFVETEAGAPWPDWIQGVGGVGPIQGGARASAVQRLEPGTYYIVDTEATGDSGELNLRQGGISRLEVKGGGDSPGDLPDTGARIVADEYSFEVSGIERGVNRVKFENDGDLAHRVRAFPVRPGFDYADAEAVFKSDTIPELSGKTAPLAPGPIVGTAQIDGGLEQVVEIDFKPGTTYVVASFVVDRNGENDARKGMIAELTVE